LTGLSYGRKTIKIKTIQSMVAMAIGYKNLLRTMEADTDGRIKVTVIFETH
jgi:hypothetical protein